MFYQRIDIKSGSKMLFYEFIYNNIDIINVIISMFNIYIKYFSKRGFNYFDSLGKDWR
jgi:hypothetical protein